MGNARIAAAVISLLLRVLACDGQQSKTATQCAYYTTRTFQTESSPEDPVAIIIRQNVQGSIKFMVRPRSMAAPEGLITVLVNWTSNMADLLDTVQSEWSTAETAEGKVVNIQLDASGPESTRSNIVPVVAGGSVAGAVTLLIIVALAVVFVIRRKARLRVSKLSRTKKEEEYALRNGNVEMDDYDGTIYPDSIFGTQQDNVSHDSTLNLSALHAEQVAEGQSFGRAATNMSTDQVSAYSGQSSRRSDKGSTSTRETAHPSTKWRAAYARQRQPSNNLDYMRPSGPIPVLPPITPSSRSPVPPAASPQPLRFSSFSQLPSVPTPGTQRKFPLSSMLRPPPLLTSRTFPPPPTSPSPSVASENKINETEEDSEDIEEEGNYNNEGGDGNENFFEDASAKEEYAPVLDVPKEFLSPEETMPPLEGVYETGLAQRAIYSSGGGRTLPLLRGSIAVFTALSVLAGSAYTYCNDKPSANILILVPPNANIAVIKLFANRNLSPFFVDTDWYLKNKELFQVFDIDDAAVSPNKHCSTKYECPSATNKSLTDCDLGSQQCVCTRGYKINNRFICEDVDECSREDVCPPGTSCRNSIGSYTCLCPPGLYREGGACVACSNGCPSGQFEAKQCTSVSDRVCNNCQKCPSGTYIFRQCSVKQDSECMHISRPNENTPGSTSWVIKDGVRLETSSNLFVEDLLASAAIEQAIYVTENTQRMSFTLERSSGVRLLVQLTDFELVPQYESSVHEADDNKFMQQLPDKMLSATYAGVRASYCSQPIPDHYTLTLKMHRSRTTAVERITCDAAKKNCPSKYRHGEVYQRRTFNTACPKANKVVTPVTDGGNSLLCTESTSLLTELFPTAAANVGKQESLLYPPPECREMMHVCRQCFSETCSGTSSCCNVACHAMPACKNATSSACNQAPVECATGDLMQYLLQPSYVAGGFRCHIKRVPTRRLVRIAYYATAPNGWNSSDRLIDVPMAGNYAGTTVADFFVVKFNTSLDISDDVTLKGTAASASNGDYIFTALERKVKQDSLEESTMATSNIVAYAKDIWLAKVQSAEPFGVNTATWRSAQGCDMDVAEGKLVVLPQKDELRRLIEEETFDEKPVELAAKRVAASGHFLYTLKSQKLPSLRLTISGNQSILPQFFSTATVDHKSVTVQLISDRGSAATVWDLVVSGNMRQCDGYVGVTVMDRTTLTYIARYDSLVSCQDDSRTPSFWLRIKIPVSKSKLGTIVAPTSSRNKLLQVDVAVGKSSTSYFVTTYAENANLDGNDVATPNDEAALAPASEDNRSERKAPQSTAVYVGAVALVAALLAGCLYTLARHGCLLVTRPQPTSSSAPPLRTGSCACRALSPLRKVLLLVLFCSYKLAYAIFFSCTALFMAAGSMSSGSVETVHALKDFHWVVMKDVAADLRSVNQWRTAEVSRQQTAYDERLAACAMYAGAKKSELSDRVAGMVSQMVEAKRTFEGVKLEALLERVIDYRERLGEHVAAYRRNITKRASDLFSEYGLLLDEVYANHWLKAPREYYMSLAANERKAKHPLLQNTAADFLNFLGIDRPSSAAKQVDVIFRQLNKAQYMSDNDLSAAINSALPGGLSSLAFYQKLLTKSAPAFGSDQLPFKAAEVSAPTANRSTVVLRTVLAIIDALIFLYRLLSAAKAARAFRHGFRERIDASPTGTGSAAKAHIATVRRELDIIRKQITVTGRRRSDDTPLARRQWASALLSAGGATCRGCARIARGPFGCRFAIWLSVVGVLLLSAASLDELLTKRVMLRASGIDRLAGSIDAYAAASDAYVRSHAAGLTRAADAAMRRELNPMLHHLLRHDSLHAYEMDWFSRMYTSRQCSLLGVASDKCSAAFSAMGWTTMSATTGTRSTSVDVTPCQALPITASQVPGTLLTIKSAIVSNEFQKYINALREVSLTTLGLVLLYVNLAVILHIAELSVVKMLQARKWAHLLKVTYTPACGSQAPSIPGDSGDAAAYREYDCADGTAGELRADTTSVHSDIKSARSEPKSALSLPRSTTSDHLVSAAARRLSEQSRHSQKSGGARPTDTRRSNSVPRSVGSTSNQCSAPPLVLGVSVSPSRSYAMPPSSPCT